jgi:hypothetical protein
MSLVDGPITAPVPVIRLNEGSALAKSADIPGRVLSHYRSTARLAPLGFTVTCNWLDRHIADQKGARDAARFARRATDVYRLYTQWAESDAEENEIAEAWTRYLKANTRATKVRAKHLRRKRFRLAKVATIASCVTGAVVLPWVSLPYVIDAPLLAGEVAVGAYAFGLVGRRQQERATKSLPTPPEPVYEPEPAPLELVTDMPLVDQPTETYEPIQDDRYQLLHDVMTTKQGDEAGVWTSVLLARLQDQMFFGDRYRDLTVDSLRDRMNRLLSELKIETGLKPYMSLGDGQSVPRAGFFYGRQINKAIRKIAADAA